jgi:hypothetical protein
MFLYRIPLGGISGVVAVQGGVPHRIQIPISPSRLVPKLCLGTDSDWNSKVFERYALKRSLGASRVGDPAFPTRS